MADTAAPSHFMGKYTGYELVDGQYHIAPTYREEFDRIFEASRGVMDIVEAVNAFAAQQKAALHRREMGLFRRISDDIGLPLHRLKYTHGIITVLPEKLEAQEG